MIDRAPDLVALDDALEMLAKQDERKGASLRHLGGLSKEGIAEMLGISTDTVTRDSNMAKLWLRGELVREKPGGG